jgi:ABC-type nickel/cobalt efflux system permease component RcnA
MPEADWHLEQGIKFAIEGIKALTIINGAAAIALMTFGTAQRSFSPATIQVLVFAVGAGISVAVFVLAYKTQLEYGNAELNNAEEKRRAWQNAQRWNNFSILAVAVSFLWEPSE